MQLGLQENPTVTLSKGCISFSSAVIGASRAFSKTVFQPGIEHVTEPIFQVTVRGNVGEAGRCVGEVVVSINQWGKSQTGIDMAG